MIPTFQLKPLHSDTDSTTDETSCISAGVPALSHTDDPGGDTDDPGGGSTNDWGSFSNFTTETLVVKEEETNTFSSLCLVLFVEEIREREKKPQIA